MRCFMAASSRRMVALSAAGAMALPEFASALRWELLSWDCATERLGIRSRKKARAIMIATGRREDTTSMRINDMGNPRAAHGAVALRETPEARLIWQTNPRVRVRPKGNAKEVIRDL